MMRRRVGVFAAIAVVAGVVGWLGLGGAPSPGAGEKRGQSEAEFMAAAGAEDGSYAVGDADTPVLISPEGESNGDRDPDTAQPIDSLDTVDRYGLERPDVYAGHFLRDGTVVTLWTDDPRTHVAALERLTTRHILAEAARYSLQELSAVRSDIEGDVDELREEEGIDVQAVAVETAANRIVIGVADVDSATRALMIDRYGGSVSIEQMRVRTLMAPPSE